MKPPNPCSNETHRQHIETIVTRHVRDMFKRLPMLAGFWLRPDLEAEISVVSWPGCDAGPGLYQQVMRSLVSLAEERPEAVALMSGRTFARALH
jgi:hypothetical protein